MDVSMIDTRLAACTVDEADVVWHSPSTPPLSLHGVQYDAEHELYLRMPWDKAVAVTPSVTVLNKMTSGGRVRFCTDSPYIAIRCVAPYFVPMAHMPLTGSHGFCFFVDGRFDGKVAPSFDNATKPEGGRISFAGSSRIHLFSEGIHDVEICLPLYGGVVAFEVGLAAGATILPAKPYRYEKPIVFYGSSITQGACATRAGNDAVNRVSRMLDAEILNLGFSGNGNAEPAMLDYLSSIDAAAFVYDYNYYLDKPDRVLPPHNEIYRRLREAHPDAAILLVDKPGCDYDRGGYEIRRKMIEETYREAIAAGDTRVGMLDAYDLFGKTDRDGCLVDYNHPNDLGFLRMAEAMAAALRPLLEQ